MVPGLPPGPGFASTAVPPRMLAVASIMGRTSSFFIALKKRGFIPLYFRLYFIKVRLLLDF